mgnify:CR=1 FL=1
MTKSGLGKQSQRQIVETVTRYSAQGQWCDTAEIYTSLFPGTVYDPACSSFRVTLSWLVRQGIIRRQRHGRYSSFYPVCTREDAP